MFTRRWITWMALITISLFFSCKGEDDSTYVRFGVGVMNAGTNEITDSSLQLGEFLDEPGVLPAHVDKLSDTPLKHSDIPSSASVSWTRKDGVRREKTVAVKAPVPSGYHIRFWFLIDDNDEVTFRAEEMKDRPLR
jgi:hypothetical protein